MQQLPREARDGLMRAWLEILRDKHPGVTWVASNQDEFNDTTNGTGELLDVSNRDDEHDLALSS